MFILIELQGFAPLLNEFVRVTFKVLYCLHLVNELMTLKGQFEIHFEMAIIVF